MDPLSELLALLKPQSYASGGVAMGREMAIQWPEHAGIKCYAVVSGHCWLSVEGGEGPIKLNAGDCYLLPPGPSFVIATDLQAAPVDFMILREARLFGQGVLGGGEEQCFLVGGHFVLTGHHAGLLLGSLPPVVHIQQEADKAAMRWSLERMAQEVREPQPGGSLIAQQLAYMMLIQALRLHLHEAKNSGVGWLFALADKQLSAALACMHNNPEQRWTLESLAAHVGMSRSAFAKHFKDTVGSAPIEYLTHWRMLLACDRLNNSADSIARIATSLGYESESAFGKAFKRVIGCSPRQHR